MALLEAEGLEGWMMVYIPPDRQVPCEVMTSTGGWNLTMDPGQFNSRSRKRAG